MINICAIVTMFDVSKRAVFGVWPEKAYLSYPMPEKKAKKGMSQFVNGCPDPCSDENFGTIAKTFGKHISCKAGKQIKG